MQERRPHHIVIPVAALFVLVLCSCSLNRLAVRAVAGVLSGGGSSTVFTGDDDPELVGAALPFAMKTYESLLAEDPTNAPLALATGRAFLSYAFAFVQAPADELPVSQADEQGAMRQRAKKLFLRGRDYVLQGLETRRPGFRAALDKDGAAAALRLVRREDEDYLYWAGAAWLAAFSADSFDFNLILTVPRAVALLQQVNAWD
ncbi:MAG TPA: TRAP transporter TatT component family protein, partial [bacterium]|nr:TRAP transporter TatT component family protein [bacterium]